jgi:hypothetical protein
MAQPQSPTVIKPSTQEFDISGWALYAPPSDDKAKKFVNKLAKDANMLDEIVAEDKYFGIGKMLKDAGVSVGLDAMYRMARPHITAAVNVGVSTAIDYVAAKVRPGGIDANTRTNISKGVTAAVTTVGGIVTTSIPQLLKANSYSRVQDFALNNIDEACGHDKELLKSEMVAHAKADVKEAFGAKIKAQMVSTLPTAALQVYDGLVDYHVRLPKQIAAAQATPPATPPAPAAGAPAPAPATPAASSIAQGLENAEGMLSGSKNAIEHGFNMAGKFVSASSTIRTWGLGITQAKLSSNATKEAGESFDKLHEVNGLKMVLHLQHEMHSHFAGPESGKPFTTMKGMDGKPISVEDAIIAIAQQHQQDMGRMPLMVNDGLREFAQKAAAELAEGHFNPIGLVKVVGTPGILTDNKKGISAVRAEAIDDVVNSLCQEFGQGKTVAKPAPTVDEPAAKTADHHEAGPQANERAATASAAHPAVKSEKLRELIGDGHASELEHHGMPEMTHTSRAMAAAGKGHGQEASAAQR